MIKNNKYFLQRFIDEFNTSQMTDLNGNQQPLINFRGPIDILYRKFHQNLRVLLMGQTIQR